MATLKEGKLLIISLFPDTQIRDAQKTYAEANRYIMSLVSEVVFGCLSDNSSLRPIYEDAKNRSNIQKTTIL